MKKRIAAIAAVLVLFVTGCAHYEYDADPYNQETGLTYDQKSENWRIPPECLVVEAKQDGFNLKKHTLGVYCLEQAADPLG